MKRSLLAFGTALLILANGAGTCFAGDELWIAVGDAGRRLSSLDGVSWGADQRWPEKGGVLWSIAYGLGRFVAVGERQGRGCLLTTVDGITWQEQSPPGPPLTAVIFGHGRFVAAQGDHLLISDDGEHFAPGARLLPEESTAATGEAPAAPLGPGVPEPSSLSSSPLQIACGDTEAGYRFVITGASLTGTGGPPFPWRAVTGDGTRLEHFAHALSPVLALAYGAGHFVALGPERIESSHDGQTWVSHPCPGDQLTSLYWDGSHFLAIGNRIIWTSPDALAWQRDPTSGLGPRDTHVGDSVWNRDVNPPLYFREERQFRLLFSHDLLDAGSLYTVDQPSFPRLRALAHRPALP